MLGDVTALILASGKATRLSKLNLNKPKTLIEFNGKPFIFYLINWLKSYGIKKFTITINSKDLDEFKKNVADLEKNIEIKFVSETVVENTTVSSFHGLSAIHTEETLLIVADSLFGVDLKKMYKFHRDSGSLVSALVTNEAGLPGYPILIGKENLVEFKDNFGSPPGHNDKEATTIGLYIANTQAMLNSIDIDNDTEINVEPLKRLKDKVSGFWLKGIYYDYGTPEKLEFLKQNFRLIKQTYMKIKQEYDRKK